MAECIAYKMNGDKCSVRANNGIYCGTHHSARTRAGPNAYEIKQLRIRHKKEIDTLIIYHGQLIEQIQDEEEIMRMHEEHAALLRMVKRRHRLEEMDLIQTQIQLIQETGVNPDAHVNDRRAAARQIRAEMMRERLAAVRDRLGAARHIPVDGAGHVADGRELANFSADRQNVHTTAAVNQTKDIISHVRSIPVPESYRWSRDVASLTPFEIGMSCKLSQKAAWQMMSMYAQDTAIYDIEEGIYGKVLDSVWQYVKASPEKEELQRILKQEMEDNIGMCAQGNLSRICNILAGYMDGVGLRESITEKLGREISALMDIEDQNDRLAAAIKILQENSVPPDQWDDWTTPLVEMEGIVIDDV